MTSLDVLKLSLNPDTTAEELLLATVAFLQQPDLAQQKPCFKASEKIDLCALLEDGSNTADFKGLYLQPEPIVKKYRQVALTKDNLINVLSKLCGYYCRAMMGVYFNATANKVVATDAHKSAMIPFAVSQTKLLKKGRFSPEPILGEKYPDYQSILRKDVKTTDIKPFDLDLVLAQLEGINAMLKFIKKPIIGVIVEFGEEIKVSANASIVYDLLLALKTLGQKVDGIFYDSPTRSIEVYARNTVVGIFMPVLNDSGYGTHSLRVRIELN
jgi:hypothetical protein